MAQAGDVDAQFEISKFLNSFGRLLYNYGKVFEVYQSRTDAGDIKAKIRLGLMYAKDFGGVRQDLYEAKKIIASIRKDVKIVDSELVELCLLAGNLDDALKFHSKAVQLFEIAAKNGDNNAPFELARLNSYKELTNKT